MPIEISYLQNKLITKEVAIENSEADITAFIKESVQKANTAEKTVAPKIIAPPKKVITIEKKKKAPAEGGC